MFRKLIKARGTLRTEALSTLVGAEPPKLELGPH